MREKNAKAKRKAQVIELENRRKAMRFTAYQRITLIPMLPNEGSYFNIKKRREAIEALGFSDAEMTMANKHITIISGGSSTNWTKIDQEIKAKHVDLGEWITNDIKKKLKKLYDDEKLTEETIDLYDIFLGMKEE